MGLAVVLHLSILRAQSVNSLRDSLPKLPFLEVNGYLKQLSTLSFDTPPRQFQYDHLIHQRSNLRLNFSSRFRLESSLRTRIFNGYAVRNTPQLADALDEDLAQTDLSWTWLRSRHTLVHSTLDRLFLSYQASRWELSLGRQRINWGRTAVWNPNDWFNTYSYLDFDYEERPGTDVLRFQYFLGPASGFELALAPGRDWDETVLAALVKFNTRDFDMQWLGGFYRQQMALGAGLAGSVKGVGLKTEAAYFQGFGAQKRAFINASFGLDYAFANGLYLQGEFLYNGNWQSDISPIVLFAEPLPATNLFIGKTALFASITYPLHPLLTVSLAGIYSPDEALYILVPGFTVSLHQNLDVLLTAQAFRNQELEQLSPTNNLVFLRLKWSF